LPVTLYIVPLSLLLSTTATDYPSMLLLQIALFMTVFGLFLVSIVPSCLLLSTIATASPSTLCWVSLAPGAAKAKLEVFAITTSTIERAAEKGIVIGNLKCVLVLSVSSKNGRKILGKELASFVKFDYSDTTGSSKVYAACSHKSVSPSILVDNLNCGLEAGNYIVAGQFSIQNYQRLYRY
jgi:hypothetical protein